MRGKVVTISSCRRTISRMGHFVSLLRRKSHIRRTHPYRIIIGWQPRLYIYAIRERARKG